MIRNLHHSVVISDIKEALKNEGHDVRNVVDIRHPKIKNPLPLFIVDLEPKENNKSISDLQFLLHTKIQVEAHRPKHEVYNVSTDKVSAIPRFIALTRLPVQVWGKT